MEMKVFLWRIELMLKMFIHFLDFFVTMSLCHYHLVYMFCFLLVHIPSIFLNDVLEKKIVSKKLIFYFFYAFLMKT